MTRSFAAPETQPARAMRGPAVVVEEGGAYLSASRCCFLRAAPRMSPRLAPESDEP